VLVRRKTVKTLHWAATCAALLSAPLVAVGQTTDGVEEIVVTGRSVSSGSATIDVEREMLVDTSKALKNIPGANANANGPISGIAQYRGMFGDRVAVVIDNLCVIGGGPNAMDSPLSYVSPMITESLQVTRGIASVSSATESIGGHVNATLARGDFGAAEFGVSGIAGARYSSNGNIRTTAARIGVADTQHRFALIAELDNGDSIQTPRGEIRPTQLDRQRYDLSYAFNGERSSLLLFAGQLDTSDTGTPALPMDIRVIDTDLYGARYSFEISDSWSVDARYGYNDVLHVMDNFGLREPPAEMRQRQNLTTGKGSLFSIAGKRRFADSTLRIGVDGAFAEHEATITNPNAAMFQVDNFVDVERDVVGLFAEWSKTAARATIEAGLRYRQVDATAGSVSASGMMGGVAPNVQILADNFNAANRQLQWDSLDAVFKLAYRISERTELQLELGSKARAPSYQELFLWLPLQATGGLADGRSYIGNLDLREERANELVLGLTSTVGQFSVAPQAFYKRVDDYIQGTPSSNMVANMVSSMMTGEPALMWSNVDAEIYGVDLAWKLQLTERISLDGIATAVRGRRTDIRDDLYRLAPYNGSVGLTYQQESWSLQSELVAYAKQDKVSRYNEESETPGYELLNVAFVWQAMSSMRLEARIDNLFDATYQDHVAGINRAAGSDIAVGERLYGGERSLSVGVQFSF
jgi:iron complex outermembrane receptor protein